jgi:peptidoglycan/LPS O-acetylase OafA/YrhL
VNYYELIAFALIAITTLAVCYCMHWLIEHKFERRKKQRRRRKRPGSGRRHNRTDRRGKGHM